MIRTVAKHRYFKGQSAKGSVRQYLGYLAYRAGSDARVNGRQFFDEDSSDISYLKMKTVFAYEPVPGQPVLAHELILSPGVQSVDAQRYTRELMGKLEKSMGRNLKWAAVVHKSKNNHIHVIIDGRDEDGMRVYLRREEYKRLREWGDRYLEKEHGLERYLDKEVDLSVPFEREKGDALYETLFDRADRESAPQAEPLTPANSRKLFGSWDQSKGIAELNDEDKIYFNGKSFHQFNTTKDLYSLLKRNRDNMSDEQITKVRKWIVDKESFGDDHHERLERESTVRKKRLHRKPRKNNQQGNKQDDKEIKRGQKKINASGRKEISTLNPFTTQEESADERVDGDDQKQEHTVEDDETESRIQLHRVEEERVARQKIEVDEERELNEKLDKEITEQNEFDLKTLGDTLNSTDLTPTHIDLHSEIDKKSTHQERTTASDREKVELRLEQERNSRLSNRESRALLQGYRGYLKSRSSFGLLKQPRLKRLLHENDREMLWRGRYERSANQADLHELQDMNTDLPIDGTSSAQDEAELEPSRDQSLSTATYEHRNIQPTAAHPLSLQPERRETLEDLMGLDTNSVEKKHYENDPSDRTQENRSKDSHQAERDKDEWKR